MLNLVAAWMIVGWTLAQPGVPRVSMTELAPPTGVSASSQPRSASVSTESEKASTEKQEPKKTTISADNTGGSNKQKRETAAPPPVVEEAQPVVNSDEVAAPPAKDTAPEPKAPVKNTDAPESGNRRPVAAFWFILPGK